MKGTGFFCFVFLVMLENEQYFSVAAPFGIEIERREVKGEFTLFEERN